MKYKLILDSTSVMRLPDNESIQADIASIPSDPNNSDYKEYLKWLEEGNTPEPADLPAPQNIDTLRHTAYVVESDPIFFRYQRGEATKEEWLAKVEEIKARYPKNN